MPRLLDADDAAALGKLLIYSMLLIWVAVVIAISLGLAVRLYLFTAFGGP